MEVISNSTRRKKYFDYGLLFTVLFLLVFGLVMIYSTSYYSSSLKHNGNGYYFLRKQLEATVIGLFFMIVTTLVPLEVYKKFYVVIYAAAFIIALLILTPLGYTANGATRWIKIFGFSLQVAEVIKIATILYTAALLDKMGYQERRSWRGLILALFPAALSAGFIWKGTNDLSSAVIIGGIAFVMLIMSDRKMIKPYFILLFALIAGALVMLAIFKGWGSFGFRGERILAWRNPEKYADSTGFQTLQALYGIGSGGVFGKGLGKSMQKLNFLPEAQNDMIFSVICEELGIFGGIAIMLMFAMLLFRIYDVTRYNRDPYTNLIVVGVLSHIAIQVVLNIAVVTNIIPNTGISLPFISYGGSSVIFLLGEIGFVLNVSRRVNFRELADEDYEKRAMKLKKKQAKSERKESNE